MGKPAAESRPEDGSHAPDSRKEPLVPPSFCGRKNIADYRKRETHHRPAANTLQCAKHDELIHAIQPKEVQFSGRPAQSGGEGETGGPPKQEPFSSVNIRQLG